MNPFSQFLLKFVLIDQNVFYFLLSKELEGLELYLCLSFDWTKLFNQIFFLLIIE